jgi:hypothetical protein
MAFAIFLQRSDVPFERIESTALSSSCCGKACGASLLPGKGVSYLAVVTKIVARSTICATSELSAAQSPE